MTSLSRVKSSTAHNNHTFIASAPGSLMLMGEHAVLYGKPSLVAAINKNITVQLTQRNDNLIKIKSALGEYSHPLEDIVNITSKPPFNFVLETIKHYAVELLQPSNILGCFGFELEIQSEFSEKLGFGSSAAVVVATAYVLEQYWGQEQQYWGQTLIVNTVFKRKLFNTAKEIIVQVQGLGSGADVAASVFGGVVYYRNKNAAPVQSFQLGSQCETHIEPLKVYPTLIAAYSGYKTPTPVVVNTVNALRKKNPLVFSKLFDAIEICTEQGKDALERNEWENFGRLMNLHHGLLCALGVSTPELDRLAHELRRDPTLLGAKISGAGLGDCVIALGEINRSTHRTNNNNEMVLQIAEEGVR